MGRLRADRGFTLLELVVVLTVIAILMGVAIPAYFTFLSNTRAAQAVADLQAVRAAVYLYYGDSGQWPAESPPGVPPTGIAPNLPKNFIFANKYYQLDYDNWVALQTRGRAPNGTDTAIGISIVSRDPKLLLRIQRLIRGATFNKISTIKYTLEIATMKGF
jgi:prepilin-type N-terminal cleavage/methylation domain-containing protein